MKAILIIQVTNGFILEPVEQHEDGVLVGGEDRRKLVAHEIRGFSNTPDILSVLTDYFKETPDVARDAS